MGGSSTSPTCGPSATRRRDPAARTPMRALIVGLGAIGQRHARNLRALCPGIELVAWRRRRRPGVITDALELVPASDPERALGVVGYDDLEAALATRPDIAIVATPTS